MSFGKTYTSSSPGNQVYPMQYFYTHDQSEDSDDSASSCVDVRHTLRNEKKQHRNSFDAISHALSLTNCGSDFLTSSSCNVYEDHAIMNAPAPQHIVQPCKPLVKRKAYTCIRVNEGPEKAAQK